MDTYYDYNPVQDERYMASHELYWAKYHARWLLTRTTREYVYDFKVAAVMIGWATTAAALMLLLFGEPVLRSLFLPAVTLPVAALTLSIQAFRAHHARAHVAQLQAKHDSLS